VEASPSDTVSFLKTALQMKAGVPPAEQQLMFAGRNLDNERSLSDYGIKEDSAIHITLQIII
jgi:large subunit ribosomal protein L40e